MFSFDSQQLQKLEGFRAAGINPYPSGPARELSVLDISEYLEWSAIRLERESETLYLPARVRFKNEMGNIGFARVECQNQMIQISIQKNKVPSESFKAWKKLDLGDWVLLTGNFTRTRTGELTFNVMDLSLYSKCLSSMPDKHTGVTDPETRQRMRYLDLIVNKSSRELFQTRSMIIRYIRRYLEDLNFMEVETPILQVIPGGASAEPFITHHNTLDTDLYMRIAPELYLKRLIVGGFERVFEIGKNFRNEGISTKHNPEFTMIEFYQAHATYTQLMDLTESMLNGLVYKMFGKLQVSYGEREIDFSSWRRVRFDDALREAGVKDPWSAESLKNFFRSRPQQQLSDEEKEVLNKGGLNGKLPDDVSTLQQWVFDEFVEPTLINPTFITHYPTEISPLARKSDDDPRVTDRFELFISGFELANGFSELNDPVDQAERFQEQVSLRDSGDDEAMYFDDDYINALSYGMPACAGQGIGIDRLVMLLTNSQCIRDVILFPTKRMKQC